MGSYRGDNTTGFQSPAQEYVEAVPDLPRDLRLEGPSRYAMRVSGDGLRERGIRDGDIVVVNAAADPVSNSVCIVVQHDEMVLATLHQQADGWAIRRGDKTVPVQDGVDVWAQVVALVRTKI